MKSLTTILAISILVISCSRKLNQTNDNRYRNEDDLINQLFWELILPIPPCDQSDTTMEGNEIHYSEFYSMLESKHHEIYFLDILKEPNIIDYKKIEVPDDFEQLFADLFNDTTLKDRKINLNPSVIGFDLKINTEFSIDSINLDSSKSKNALALMEFSRIAFNRDYSKACFLLSIIQNKECKQKFVYLANKQLDKWTFNRRLSLY